MNFDNHGLILPDVSFYQDDDSTPQKVDFVRMRQAGAVGVIIRAGQNRWVDEDFRDHWREAKAAGLPRGSYWFYDSRAEPGAQATLWRAQIENDLPELGLWIDLEESYHGTWQGERNWKTFIEAVQIMFPRVLIGIYTANWWWQGQTVRDPAYFGRYPLWIAQYVSTPLYVVLPKPWETQKAKLWQYTAKGDGPHYGTESLNVDLNYWNGDMDSFRQFFHLEGEGETPPPPTGETMFYKVLATVLNIRSGPGISYTDIGDLLRGDILEVSETVGSWHHLKGITRGGVPRDLPLADRSWCSSSPAYVEAYTPAEEPTKTPFTLTVQGFKPFSGELEKE